MKEDTFIKTDFYAFPLGDCECVSLWDGVFVYKPESLVANAPQEQVASALLARGLPVNMIETPYSYLFVRTKEHRILVDMGAGVLAPTTGNLLNSMHHAGIPLESIDSIFITHAHPDHIGGMLNNEGKPVFPQATYYLAKVEWEFWFSDQAASRVGEWMTHFAQRALTPIKEKIVLLERKGEISPGASVLFTPGHTPGHMVVSFTSGKEQLLYTGDVVIHPLHLEHPDWLPIFDILPEEAASSKRYIFDLAASSGSWVLGQHFPPFPSLGHIYKRDNGWEWEPINIEE